MIKRNVELTIIGLVFYYDDIGNLARIIVVENKRGILIEGTFQS